MMLKAMVLGGYGSSSGSCCVESGDDEVRM